MDNNWKEQISEILRQHPYGLSIKDLSEKTGVSRITISLALAELKGEKKIQVRRVAAAKLHYWKDENE